MGVPDARLSAKTMQLLKVYRRSGVLARLPAAVKQIVPASGGGKKPTKKPSKGCMCAKIHKPVCGKDGKTYPNACMAKCAKVAIKEHKACAQNMEAARVFSTFLKGNSKWMSDFQKSWKCGSKMPITTTKKTVGTTKAAYASSLATVVPSQLCTTPRRTVRSVNRQNAQPGNVSTTHPCRKNLSKNLSCLRLALARPFTN